MVFKIGNGFRKFRLDPKMEFLKSRIGNELDSGS